MIVVRYKKLIIFCLQIGSCLAVCRMLRCCFGGGISLERNGLLDTGHFFFFAILNATIVIDSTNELSAHVEEIFKQYVHPFKILSLLSYLWVSRFRLRFNERF